MEYLYKITLWFILAVTAPIAGLAQSDTTIVTRDTVTTAVTVDTCGSYKWDGGNGVVYTVSVDTVYTIVTRDTNVIGDTIFIRDSIFIDTLHLTIHNPVHTAVYETVCGSFTWHDTTYTVSGNYLHSHEDANGCTQVDTLHLTVNQPTIGDTTAVECESFSWHGVTYTETPVTAPTYTMVGSNHNSCDSIVTLNLTINHATYGDTTAVECESFTWHGVTYTETPVTAPTYTMVGSNHNGCDSIVTLHLTVNHSNTGIDEQTACDSYVWIDGNAYTASNNTATFTLTNAAGCDSTVTLHLTVNHSTTSVTSVTACDSFEWNGQTYTSSGIYNYQTTNAAGCDSVMTLHLIVNTTGSTQVFDTICEGEVYPFFGQLLYSTGVYTDTLFSSKGCDSVITLNLTVNPLPHVSISGDTSICQGQTTTLSASGGGSYLWSNTSTQTNISVSQSGTYTVTVTNTYRCSATSSVIVTVNPLPNVIISGDTTFCQGSSTTLTANGALNYTWNNASTNPSITVSNADTYTVTGTDTNDCSNTANKTVSVNPTYNITVYDSICQGGSYNFFGQNLTTADTYSHTLYTSKGCDSVITLVLTVNPLPSVTISDSSHFCQGDSLTLTAIGENIDTYVWSTGDTSASKIVNAAGKYTVTATNTNGCTASAEKSITTDPLPVISITGNVSFCADSSTTLTASGASTYVWSSGVYTDSITVNSAGQYTVTGTDNNGCAGSATIMTFVKPLPTPVITGPSTICQGDTATLAAIGGNTYHWSNGSTQNSISVSQNGTYTVTATSAENCFATADFTLTVNSLPNVTISGNTTFCQGTTTTLNAAGANTYTWSGGVNSESIIISSAGSYTVTGTDANGCSNTASETVTMNLTYNTPLTASICQGESYDFYGQPLDTTGVYTHTLQTVHGCDSIITLTLTVNQLPKPIITGDLTICPEEETTLIAGGGAQYDWSTGATTNQITVQDTGVYSVTVTDSYGCQASAAVTVSYDSTALTKKAIVCKRKADGTPRMLLYPDPDLQYQWYHNGTAMNGENKQYYAPDAGFAMDGSCYTVRVKPVGSDDCGFVTLPWCYTSNTTAKLSILPNPNDGRFRLLLPDDAINVRIYNANGQLVLDRETDGEVELTISADLANGFYMVKVQRENGETNTEKLVINR